METSDCPKEASSDCPKQLATEYPKQLATECPKQLATRLGSKIITRWRRVSPNVLGTTVTLMTGYQCKVTVSET